MYKKKLSYILGGFERDGKSKSVWDTFSHTEKKIEDGNNGDVACDSYNNYLEDVQLIKVSNFKICFVTVFICLNRYLLNIVI